MNHDDLCPASDVSPTRKLVEEYVICQCDLIFKAKQAERFRIAHMLWPQIQSVASWVAGVNMERIATDE